GVAHDLPADAIVRHLVDDVAADAVVLQRLEVLGDVHGPSAAVAGDDRRYALEQVTQVRAHGRLREGLITVRVQVDEPGGGDEAGAVEDARLVGQAEPAEGDDAFAADGDVARLAGLAAAVVDRDVTDHDIRLDGRVGSGEDGKQGQRDKH